MSNPTQEGSNYPSKYEDDISSGLWPESSSGDAFNITLSRRIRNSILSIQNTLGIDPQGSSLTVKDRISSLEISKSNVGHNHNLSNLLDVNISSITNGQILEWNSSTGKWINVNKPNSAVWGSITGILSNQSDLQSVLNNKASLINENLFKVNGREKIKISDDYIEIYGVFSNPVNGFPSVQVPYRSFTLLNGLDHTKGTIQNQIDAITSGGVAGGTIAYIDKSNTFTLMQKFSNADRHLSSESGTNLFDFNIHDGSLPWNHDPINDPNLNKDGAFRFGANTNTGGRSLTTVWFKGNGGGDIVDAAMQLIHTRGILALYGSHYAYGFISYNGLTSQLGQVENWDGHTLAVNAVPVLKIKPRIDGSDVSGYKGGYLEFKGVLTSLGATGTLYFDSLAGYSNKFRFSHNISSPAFEGNGTNLTGLSAGNISAGTLPIIRGGTGVTSGTNNGIAYYSITGPRINYTTAGTANQVLLGSAGAPAFGQISNSHISSSAAISDSKLATISTSGKVSDSALSANVAFYNRTTAFTVNQTFNEMIYGKSAIYTNSDGSNSSEDAIYYFGNSNSHYLRWFASEQVFQFTHDLKIGDGSGKIITSGEMITKVANSLKVEHIPITSTILTNKYVNLEQYVLVQSNFVLMVSGGPTQVLGIDYILQETGGSGTGYNRVNWSGLGLDGLLTTSATLILIYQPGLTIVPTGFLQYMAGTDSEPYYIGDQVKVQ